MKKSFIIYFFSVLFVISVISCSKDDTVDHNINASLKKEIPIYDGDKVIGYANASEFTIATDEELKIFQEKGWLSSNEVQSRSVTCEWSDGVGGSIECDGGTCRVVHFYNSQTGTTSHGIGCFIDGEIDHAGAFR